MAWQQVTSGGTFFKFENEGDTVEGVLTGSRVGEYGLLFGFTKQDGSKVEIAESYILKETLPPLIGKVVRVEYKGKKPTKSGKTVRDYAVSVSDENAEVYVQHGGEDESAPF